MIDFELDRVEARIFGVLIEKAMATPEYYPLSLNSLINACNQKSNREPVVTYDEETVVDAIATLREKRLVVRSEAGRVFKYAECFVGNAKLIGREAAIICLLLLRGPQTVGELRGRSERLYKFADLEEVAETLQELTEMELVKKQPRLPGRKESRFMHLLLADESAGTVAPGEEITDSGMDELPTGEKNNRLSQLEEEVAVLKEELGHLRRDFLAFMVQFE